MNSYERIYSLLLEERRLHGGRRETKQARKARKRKPEDSSSAELSRDPDYFGATIEGTPKSKKRVARVKNLKGFEPEEKMKSPESRAKIDSIKKAMKAGKKMPRIVTHGKTYIDGHHRMQATRELGIDKVKTVSAGKTTDKDKGGISISSSRRRRSS